MCVMCVMCGCVGWIVGVLGGYQAWYLGVGVTLIKEHCQDIEMDTLDHVRYHPSVVILLDIWSW